MGFVYPGYPLTRSSTSEERSADLARIDASIRREFLLKTIVSIVGAVTTLVMVACWFLGWI